MVKYFNKIIILINSNFKVMMLYRVLDEYLENHESVFEQTYYSNCKIY